MGEVEAAKRVLARAKRDFGWFCERFLRIKDKGGRIVPLVLNEAQWVIVRAIQAQVDAGRPVRIVGVKGRQQGFSTVGMAYLAWKAFVNSGQSCLVIAQDLEPASQLFGKVELMHHYYPELFRPPKAPGVRAGRKLVFDEPLHSMIYVDTSENRDAGRSGTFQHAWCTEIPYWPDAERTMSGLLQSIPPSPGTSIIIESTAGGVGDWFHELWLKAADPASEFDQVFVPWFLTVEYRRVRNPADEPLSGFERGLGKRFGLDDSQLLWYRDKRAALGDDKLAQEFPCTADEAFLASGRPYFRREALQRVRGEVMSPLRRGWFKQVRSRVGLVESESDRANGWWVWKYPVRSHFYTVFADPASGRAKDRSAIQVVDVSEWTQCASFLSPTTTPDELAREVYWMGKLYNWALASPENNNHGELTIYKLKELGYGNLYRHVDRSTALESERSEYGWRTTSKTRPLMISRLGELVHSGELSVFCQRTLREMESFVFDEAGKRAEAQTGAHDDLVMSLAGAVTIGSGRMGEITYDRSSRDRITNSFV